MRIIPSPTPLHHLLFYFKMFRGFFILWIVCRVLVYVITIVGLILLIKYAAYLPDNPNYRRNYDDIKVLPRNPFTEAPATKRQSEIDHENAMKSRK